MGKRDEHTALGMSISFLCRKPGGRFYSMDSESVEAIKKYMFKCPHCGERHRPTADNMDSVEAVLALQWIDPETGMQQNNPCAWQPGEDLSRFNEQIGIFARSVTTPGDITAWHDKSKLD